MTKVELGIDEGEVNTKVYGTFITQLRESARKTSVHHKFGDTGFEVGILTNTTDRIHDVTISMDEKIFTLHIQNSDVYFLGYKLETGDDKWVSIAESPIALNNILAEHVTGFNESYGAMGYSNAKDLTKPILGFYKIRKAMIVLERFYLERNRSNMTEVKDACVVVILMICEAARCETVFTEVQNIYIKTGKIQEGTAELIKDWNKQCGKYHQEFKKYIEYHREPQRFGECHQEVCHYSGSLRLVKEKTNSPSAMLKGETSRLRKDGTSKWAHNPKKKK